MKITNKFKNACLAIAGIAFLSISAQAAPLSTSNYKGAIFLGFTKSGATTDLTIAIGTIPGVTIDGLSQLTGNVALGNYNTQLVAALGGSWYSQGYFSAFGIDTTSLNQKLYLTAPGTAVNLASAQVTSSYSAINSTILNNLNNGSGGILQDTVPGVATNANYSDNMVSFTGAAQAWQVIPGATNNPELAVQSGSISNKLYLDTYTVTYGARSAITGATVAALAPVPQGYLSISSTGDVTFTTVPEPSTYASLAIGLGIVAVALRRRTVKA